MNMHQPISELQRQHAAHKARRAKLWGARPSGPEEKLPARLYMEPIEIEEIPEFEEPELMEIDFSVSFSITQTLQPEIYGTVDLSNSIRRTMAEICEDVLRNFPGVTMADIKGPRRQRVFIEARHECMWQVYQQRRDISFPMMGRFFRRDHTSCLSAVHKRLKALRGKAATKE